MEELQGQIRHKKDAVQLRDNEYREYFERKETIRNQSVSQELYNGNEEALEGLKSSIGEQTEKIRAASEELGALRDSVKKIEAEIQKAVREIEEKDGGQKILGSFAVSINLMSRIMQNWDGAEKNRKHYLKENNFQITS